jgi:hypothetical protein
MSRYPSSSLARAIRASPIKTNGWSAVLPIKAVFNQIELLKTLGSLEQNSDNRVWQDGRASPLSNAYLARTDQRQATGVWYAVDRELLLGVGR